MSATATTIAATDSLRDTFASAFKESKNGYLKKWSIVRSSSASVSLLASLLLVWILNRSRPRFTTTYHRLILGMSTFDILFSMSFVTFGLASPADLNYVVWNARGNLVTCNVFGFMATWAGSAAPMYSASLNLYYLAKIKYNKPDSYIASKLEPPLHAIPILYALVRSIIYITQEGINSSNSGACGPSPYNPPHCNGFEDGQIPDGFEIPCGRGNSFYQGAGVILLYSYVATTIFFVPLTMGGSLFMIYRSISSQEERMTRYGARTLEHPRPTSDNAAEGSDERQNNIVTNVSSIMSSIMRSFRNTSGRGSESGNQESSQSRAVSRRAAAYSISYLVTWFWPIVHFILKLAGMWPTEVPPPTWQVAFNYLFTFFLPLQGLWTFLVYMHPKVVHAKRMSDRNISWFGAFLDVLWLATTGCKRPPCSCRIGRRKDTTPDETQGNQGTAATPGIGPVNALTLRSGETNTTPTAEGTDATREETNSRSPRAGATDEIHQNEQTTVASEVDGDFPVWWLH